jgi:tetratricopeptide (TPR) repeat protein
VPPIESEAPACAPDYPLAVDRERSVPASAKALNERGLSRLLRRDLAGACADFQAALGQRPDYAEALNNRGVVRFQRGDLTGARKDFDAALRARNDYAEAYQNRGALRLFQRAFAEALADLDTALRLMPASPTALILRGNARWHLGDLQGFIDDYREAFCADRPLATAEVLNRLLFDARRDPASAQADCDAHLRHDPCDGVAHARRGFLLLLRGQAAAAQAHFERCRRTTPALMPIIETMLQAIQERRLLRGHRVS